MPLKFRCFLSEFQLNTALRKSFAYMKRLELVKIERLLLSIKSGTRYLFTIKRVILTSNIPIHSLNFHELRSLLFVCKKFCIFSCMLVIFIVNKKFNLFSLWKCYGNKLKRRKIKWKIMRKKLCFLLVTYRTRIKAKVKFMHLKIEHKNKKQKKNK